MRYLCIAALALLALQPLLAAESFPINVYPCPRAESAPVLDGVLDDDAWLTAPLVSGFTHYASGELAQPQTSFRVLWDDAHLYLGVRCEEPLMEQVNVQRTAHDEHAIFRSETIEFFVDPDHDHDRYYQLAFSVAGSLYDGERMNTTWSSNAQVAASAGEDHWSAEIAVPWETLRSRPEPGKIVGFNISRDRNVGEKMYTSWARVDTTLGFHDPDRFAHLVLDGTPERIGSLSKELRKGDRSGAITVFSSEGFATTTYAQLATAAFAEVEALIGDLDRQRREEKDPAAVEEIGRRLAEYRARLAEMKADAQGPLNAAEWTQLDLALQELVSSLRETVSEARLKALIDRI